MGLSLRDTYNKGTGINSGIAIQKNFNGNAINHAAGWGFSIGSPILLETNFKNEITSDWCGWHRTRHIFDFS